MRPFYGAFLVQNRRALDATHGATLSGGRCNQSNVAPQSEIAESPAHASTYLKERLDKYTGIGELSCAGCNAYEKCRSMGGFGMPKHVSVPFGISTVLMLTALGSGPVNLLAGAATH